MHFKSILLLASMALILAACQSPAPSTSTTPTVASFELLDPNAAANNEFGTTTVTLANGNIVVASPYDDTVATNAGAVHLYNPFTKTVIASFYGDDADDYLGSSSVTALGNNNFVIASRFDDDGTKSPSVVNAGSVMLVSGVDGIQIGTTLVGDTAYDYHGESSVTALGNNNFVIASSLDDDDTTNPSVVNAGSVMLINGATGDPIGTTLVGDTAHDQLGGSSVTALGNNNFVIASASDSVGGSDTGSIRQIDTTGTQVSIIAGAATDDMVNISVTDASTHNFYVVSLSKFDNYSSMTDSGFATVVAY